MHDGGAQRVLIRFLERVEVADRGASLDGPRFLDGAGGEQQRLGERGLAGPSLADKRNRAMLAVA
jgi:hypothetical protein